MYLFHVKHCFSLAFVFHVKQAHKALVLPCSVLPCVHLSVSRQSAPYVVDFRHRPPRLPCSGNRPIFNFQGSCGYAPRRAFILASFPLALALFLSHRGLGGGLPAALSFALSGDSIARKHENVKIKKFIFQNFFYDFLHNFCLYYYDLSIFEIKTLKKSRIFQKVIKNCTNVLPGILIF